MENKTGDYKQLNNKQGKKEEVGNQFWRKHVNDSHADGSQ